MRTMIAQDWGKPDNVFAELFSLGMIPDGTPGQRRWLTDLQRKSASTENALRFHDTGGDIQVADLLPEIAAPTLVLHARGDRRVEFDEGRNIARLIPNARFVPLDSNNHILLEHEPAWTQVKEEIRAFLLG
jgi:pimeloyl-ACP methyl ester carboxylesterase